MILKPSWTSISERDPKAEGVQTEGQRSEVQTLQPSACFTHRAFPASLSCSFGLSGLSGFWLNETNQMNEIDQMNQIDISRASVADWQ
jgi:hypothetical protein